MKLQILYQDQNYLAINKSAGLLVHRTKLDRLATEFAVQTLQDQINQKVYPCHRLDRATSGVLLFALNQEAAAFASQQFSERKVLKTYHAIVRGWIDDSGSIDYDLRSEDRPDRTQSALTEYNCLCRSEIPLPIGRYQQARFSLVELRPKTGRKHQLRRHMAHLRHPILGDTRHGDGAQNKFIREHYNCHQLLLRAVKLQLSHPNSRAELTILANYTGTFQRLAESLKLSRQSDREPSPAEHRV